MDANALHLAAYERALRARKRSPRTLQTYQEALLQLAAYHDGADLCDLEQADLEKYIGSLLERHSSATAAARYRSLRAFYNWCVAEERIDRSPMARMKLPEETRVPVPVVDDDTLRLLLRTCGGKDFDDRRDTAIIRLWCEPGSPRVSEMAGVTVEAVDMRRDLVRLHGKGDKVRDIPFGPRTGQALDRYLMVRRRHPLADQPAMWLTGRRKRLGVRAPGLTASGLYQMLEARCDQAGIPRIHPHQLRHTAAHVWHDQGGSEADAMALFGWSSPEMPRRYGESAKVERAQRAARRTTMADRL